MSKKFKVATHNGPFHADDVVAGAILNTLRRFPARLPMLRVRAFRRF